MIQSRKNIPKAVRQQVWVEKIGEKYKGECRIEWCRNTITVFSFHCGHDIPHSQGGTLDISNLQPICQSCNLSMGDKYTIQEWNKMYTHTRKSWLPCCFVKQATTF